MCYIKHYINVKIINTFIFFYLSICVMFLGVGNIFRVLLGRVELIKLSYLEFQEDNNLLKTNCFFKCQNKEGTVMPLVSYKASLHIGNGG